MGSPGRPRWYPVLIRAVIVTALALAVARAAGTAPQNAAYPYLSPVPGSRLVSPWNNIVIRHGSPIDPRSLTAAVLEVTGSQSGVHRGALELADDAMTLLFSPERPFALGEEVTVRFAGGARSAAGAALPPMEFSFSVASADPERQPRPSLERMLGVAPPGWTASAIPAPDGGVAPGAEPRGAVPALGPTAALSRMTFAAGSALPASYPLVSLLAANAPEPGSVFLAPFPPFAHPSPPGNLLILDNLGAPLFYRRTPARAFDFKMQPDGRLTYFSESRYRFYALDSSYAVVDSFWARNGYTADLHELQVLPNGHALLQAYDPQPVGMDTVVAGGDPDAIVTGLVIQEIDTAKRVVFQWRSWDHFAITDAASPDVDLTNARIDYVHGNAIELDHDGNLLISSRYLNEITKIDRQTGDIIWRMGLHAKNNQFTFIGDARGFSHQHDIRRLPNGHITLFDNGNHLDPEYSRALEYDLDEENKVARLVWEHRNAPDLYGSFMGNAQRLAGGGTMIGWGGTDLGPRLTEIDPGGSKAYEIGLAPRTWTYRAFRFPWRSSLLASDVDSLDFGSILAGDSVSRRVTLRNDSQVGLSIGSIAWTDPSFSVDAALPLALPARDSVTVEVRCKPGYVEGRVGATLYVMAVSDTELVSRPVTLTAAGRVKPAPALFANAPNPFTRETAIAFELPRQSRVSIEVYDVRGRRVDTIVNGIRPAGRYELPWAPRGLASGVYFYRLKAGAFEATRKLVLID